MILLPLKHALRSLSRRPWLTTATVSLLAVGLSIASGAFAVAKVYLFSAAPGVDATRLYSIYRVASQPAGPTGMENRIPLSLADLEVLRGPRLTLGNVVAYLNARAAVRFGASRSEIVNVELVSERFFETLGILLEEGRSWNSADRGQRVAIVSSALWRRLSPAETLGTATVHVNGRPYSIVGVAARPFSGLSSPGLHEVSVWLPLDVAADDVGTPVNWSAQGREYPGLAAKLQLQESVTEQQAQAFLESLRPPWLIERTPPEKFIAVSVKQEGPLPAYRDQLVQITGATVGAATMILLVVVVSVVCINLASLTRRNSETAVHIALGASRWQLAAAQSAEVLTVLVVAGLAAWATGYWLLSLVARSSSAYGFEISLPSQIGPVLGQSVGLYCCIIFIGLVGSWYGWIALQAFSAPSRWLRNMPSSRALRTVLFGQTIIATCLTVFAAATARNLFALDHREDSRPEEDVAYVALDISRLNESVVPSLPLLVSNITSQLSTDVSVREFGFATGFPVSADGETLRVVPESEGRPARTARVIGIEGAATTLMGIQSISMLPESGRTGDGGWCILPKGTSDYLFPELSPIGRELEFARPVSKRAVVIGVVADTDVRRFGERSRLLVYTDLNSRKFSKLYILVRSKDRLASGVASLERIADRLPRDIPLSDRGTVEGFYRRTQAPVRSKVALLLGLSGLLCVLVAAGTAGTTSAVLASRRKEFAVRQVLGVPSFALARLVAAYTLPAVMLGAIVGLASAWGIGRFLPPDILVTGDLAAYWIAGSIPTASAVVSVTLAFVVAPRTSLASCLRGH